jgi:hypothetical protein
MTKQRTIGAAMALVLTCTIAGGCQQLPGTREQQTTAGGALAGAALGALLADENNKLLGLLLGGAAGATGGYLLGANTDWFDGTRQDASAQAREAVSTAQANPATPEQARVARTADIDRNGFVTMDEMVAMEQAGLTDDQQLQRLRATGAVFDLSVEQAQDLLNAGVSPEVVNELETINRAERDRILGAPPVS